MSGGARQTIRTRSPLLLNRFHRFSRCGRRLYQKRTFLIQTNHFLSCSDPKLNLGSCLKVCRDRHDISMFIDVEPPKLAGNLKLGWIRKSTPDHGHRVLRTAAARRQAVLLQSSLRLCRWLIRPERAGIRRGIIQINPVTEGCEGRHVRVTWEQGHARILPCVRQDGEIWWKYPEHSAFS